MKRTQTLHPTTTYPAVVGRILVMAREAIGLDQGQLATAVGVSQSTWSRIENGASGFSIEQFAKAAHALGRTPGYLMTEADTAVRGLEAKGVQVSSERLNAEMTNGAAIIGAVALGILIVALLAKK